MAKVKQLTVALENQPGRLAAVAKVLADAKVNIVDILGSTAGAQGSAQFAVDNIIKAKKALSVAQFAYAEGTLEQVEIPNKPGALAPLPRSSPKRARISTQYTVRCPKARRNPFCFSPPQNRLRGRGAFLSRDAASVVGLDVFEADRWPTPTATSDTAGRSSLRVAVVFVFGVLFLILLDVVFLFFVVFF